MNDTPIVWRPLSTIPLRTPQKILIRLKLSEDAIPFRWQPYTEAVNRKQFGGRWQAPDAKGYFHNRTLPTGRDAVSWEWCPDPTRKD